MVWEEIFNRYAYFYVNIISRPLNINKNKSIRGLDYNVNCRR